MEAEELIEKQCKKGEFLKVTVGKKHEGKNEENGCYSQP